jgi:uncharacterized protein (TIGR03437 family)
LSVNSVTADALVTNTSPGIFTVNGAGTGVPAANVIATLNDGSSEALLPYQCGANGCSITPILLPNNLAALYIVLYGTGFRNALNVSASLGSMSAEVVYSGAVATYPGLDQVNLRVMNPSALTGQQTVVLEADGVFSNTVSLLFP